jgi:hypothetical protein
MSYPYGPAPTGPISAPPNDRRPVVIVLAVVAALLLTLLGVGAVLVFSGNDNQLKATPAPELVLEAANSSGTDPFSPSVAVSNRPLDPAVRTLAHQGPITPRGVQAVDGTAVGLYGGTGESSCDTAELANYLADNPAKAQAWASVFGITVDQIPYYLDTLTPVYLGRDTWVTNHSYSGGVATPFQSVLQAGTAVLVDAYGVPRVNCNCGNPLAPPASTPLAGYRTVGTPWDHYAPREVVYVTYYNEHTTIINNTTTVVAAPNPLPAPPSLTLIDLNTLQPLIRAVGGILNLQGLPPLTAALPSPASLNTPFASPDPEVQAANGVQADGQPAENVLRQADAAAEPSNGTSGPGTSSVVDGPAAPQQVAPGESSNASVPAPPTSSSSTEPVPAPPAASAPPASVPPAAPGPETSAPAPAVPPAPETSAPAAIAPPPASAAPVPTVFTGSGDIISSITFGVNGTVVTCTVTDPTAAISELDCTDDVVRTVSTAQLGTAAVTSATDAAGVWTVRLTTGTTVEPVVVTSAVWTLIPAAVEAPPAAETVPTSEPAEEVPASPVPAVP